MTRCSIPKRAICDFQKGASRWASKSDHRWRCMHCRLKSRRKDERQLVTTRVGTSDDRVTQLWTIHFSVEHSPGVAVIAWASRRRPFSS